MELSKVNPPRAKIKGQKAKGKNGEMSGFSPSVTSLPPFVFIVLFTFAFAFCFHY